MKTNRRDFLSRVVPCCAVTCMASQNLLASAVIAEGKRVIQDQDKYDRVIDGEMTFKQWERSRHSKYIGILNQLGKLIGRDRMLELIKKSSFADNVELGKRLAGRIDSLSVFAEPFRNEKSALSQTMIREIVEDSNESFEMRITSCLTEKIFRETNARDLGYACVCHADFGLPVGVNSKLKLIRTKTLMQGHECCNHRYVWEK